MTTESLDLHTLATSIVAGANDAIVAVDVDGLITVWNEGAVLLLGWSAEEMIGRTPEVLMPKDRRHEMLCVQRAREGVRETASLETVRLHRSGRPVPVSRRTSPILDPSGHVIGVCAIFRDISREIALRQQLEQTRQLAEARFHQSVMAQVTVAPDGTILEVNRALCRLSGYEEKELLGRRTSEFIDEPHRAEAASKLAMLASGELEDSKHPRLLRHADGHLVETQISVFVVRDEANGQVCRLEATIEDVSAAAAAQRELQLRETRWQSLVVNSADVGLFCSASAEVLFVSSSALSQFGYRPEEVVGSVGFSFWHPDDVSGVRSLWEATVAAPTGTTHVFEGRIRHADGSWRWVQETLTNRLDEPGVEAMVANLRDITERKSAEAVLEELAGMDALTGLPTRAPLMAALDAAFAADLAGETAVGVLDLARFKLVNDTFGQLGGDGVLMEVASRLHAQVGDRGVVARLGGDRFAVMLRDQDHIGEVFECFGALLAEVERPLDLDGRTQVLTAAVGAALGPAVDSGALLSSAEAALATAKLGLTGPMHIVRAESSSASIFRARLIEDLRRGVDADEFVVHYQPVLAVRDGRPVGAEALVRWAHPEKGLISPGAFIGAAEDSGLIRVIGQKVLAEACRAAARWGGAGDRAGFHVAVNLSAKQLTRSGVVDVVKEALAESGASPRNLMLEVTESVVMADVDAAVATLQGLRSLGVAIAIDDFGTGYSSLTYLKQFPVTALKIDRSFVSGLGQSNDDAAIVSSVISLARAMRLDCIAEGVETEQQRLVLQALGCSYGQGFLWSRAVEGSTLDAWFGEDHPVDLRDADPACCPSPEQAAEPQPAGLSPQARRRVDELCSTGASPATIAAALNADRLLTGTGRRWTSRSVATLLATRSAG